MSDELKFTKGEWKIEDRGGGDPLICAEVYRNTEFGIYPALARVNVFDRFDFLHRDEALANAHLIAAAPDLYEACKQSLLMLELRRSRLEREDKKPIPDDSSLAVAIAKTTAALAKARGE